MAFVRGNLCPNCFKGAFSGGKCPQCGYSAAVGPENRLVLPPGKVLNNQYMVGKVLGIGGFGITYLAMDIQSNTLCAIKEYFPTSIAIRGADASVSAGNNQDTFMFGIKAFFSEAETLKTFLGSSCIVQIFSSFQDNGTAYYAMEFLDGMNAGRLTKNNGGKLPYALAIEILLRISDALQQVHRKGLLHRDVSPENIFVTRAGLVKLIDFGATRFFIGERSMSLSVVLKPGFAPPEQYSSKGNQGPWTDIYALAATFYYLSSGIVIPDALDRRSGTQIMQLKDIVPGMSGAVSEIIDVALRLDYKERFQTIDNFHSVVQMEVSGAAVSSPARRAPPRNPAPRASKQAPAPRSGLNPYLTVISGKFKGNRWKLQGNSDIVVGRSINDCSIIVDDPSISRKHCIIRYDANSRSFQLKDTSTNGTYSQTGQRLTPGVFYNMSPNSRFYLSTADIMFMVGFE